MHAGLFYAGVAISRTGNESWNSNALPTPHTERRFAQTRKLGVRRTPKNTTGVTGTSCSSTGGGTVRIRGGSRSLAHRRLFQQWDLSLQPPFQTSDFAFNAYRLRSPDGRASLESSYVVHQIPDVLVRFDFSKRRHPTQTNSILHNPEQFSIGVASNRTRREIRSARIHPPTVVSEWVAVGAMAHDTVGAIEFSPSSMLACRFAGAGGIPSRLFQRTRRCFACVATTVSRWQGS
jgi:hypothetical protein